MSRSRVVSASCDRAFTVMTIEPVPVAPLVSVTVAVTWYDPDVE